MNKVSLTANRHLVTLVTPYASTPEGRGENKMCAKLTRFRLDLYVIGWTKAERHTGRFLKLEESGNAAMTQNFDLASRFTREEVNTILLALWNAERWSEAGMESYPDFSQVN